METLLFLLSFLAGALAINFLNGGHAAKFVGCMILAIFLYDVSLFINCDDNENPLLNIPYELLLNNGCVVQEIADQHKF